MIEGDRGAFERGRAQRDAPCREPRREQTLERAGARPLHPPDAAVHRRHAGLEGREVPGIAAQAGGRRPEIEHRHVVPELARGRGVLRGQHLERHEPLRRIVADERAPDEAASAVGAEDDPGPVLPVRRSDAHAPRLARQGDHALPLAARDAERFGRAQQRVIEVLAPNDAEHVALGPQRLAPRVHEADGVDGDGRYVDAHVEPAEQLVGALHHAAAAQLVPRKHRRVQEQRARGQAAIAPGELNGSRRPRRAGAHDHDIPEGHGRRPVTVQVTEVHS